MSSKRMSVAVDYEGDHVLICKGAVEDIYKVCTHYQIDDEIHLMIDLIKDDLLEEYEELSRDGYRVLGIAYREFPQSKQVFSVADESDLILLGYIAFLDPPKGSAAKAIASLKQFGVATKILTGDNALVTRKICKDVGLGDQEVITGDKLLGLDEAQLGELAEENNVFARLSPSQKENIITVLQKRGHVVGYMGDGINDALSMRAADVGISVDSAVDVAKESADIDRHYRFAKTRPCSWLHGRRHQRRSFDARGRCWHFCRFGGRCREGIGRYHSSRKKSPRA